MTNKHNVKKACRLRAQAGKPGRLSEFAQRMLAHIEQTRKELERIAYRSQRGKES